MKNSMKVAFCGVAAALSTALMFLTGVIPIATLALPALAGCLLIPVVAEAGLPWGFGVYAVCCTLSFLLAPDREAALFYLLFFGYYPALYAVLGRIKNRAARYAAKLAVFNAAVAAETLLAVYVLKIPLEAVGFLGDFTLPVLWLLANVVFVFYDYALEGLIVIYMKRFHEKFGRMFRLK